MGVEEDEEAGWAHRGSAGREPDRVHGSVHRYSPRNAAARRGTHHPIAQGPMTRVSDTAAFGGAALVSAPNTGVNTGEGLNGPRRDYAINLEVHRRTIARLEFKKYAGKL